MKQWLARVRGAVGMGVTWAAEWLVAGLMIGVGSKLLPGLPWHWFFDHFDAPLPALAIPGFFGGIFFSIVLGIAGRHRRFRDLSIPQFAAWGALGGVLLTLFPFALDALGLATLNVSASSILIGFGVPFVLLGAASASISLLLARRSSADALPAEIKGSESLIGPTSPTPLAMDSDGFTRRRGQRPENAEDRARSLGDSG